jgi:hypothetical protein
MMTEGEENLEWLKNALANTLMPLRLPQMTVTFFKITFMSMF